VLAGERYRLVEIEFYYHGTKHLDPFAHQHPLQQTSGRWYFHRDGEQYRGGSFKGLDLTFGSGDSFGGILIRSIMRSDGLLINGCSLCVDHILQRTQYAHISALDQEIAQRTVWDESSPVHLCNASALLSQQIIFTARVGLTLKRADQYPDMFRFMMREYRFLTNPSIAKGKIHTIISLHKQGLSLEQIADITHSSMRNVRYYIELFQNGTTLESVQSFYGQHLKSSDLCKLHGLWSRTFEHQGKN
jgi:hypothetical protein